MAKKSGIEQRTKQFLSNDVEEIESRQKGLALMRYLSPDLEPHPDDSKFIAEKKSQLATYLEICEKADIKAGAMGSYRAMGITKQIFSNWLKGRDGAEKQRLAESIKSFFGGLRENQALEGQVNPAVAIFYHKNFDGMADFQKDDMETEDSLGAEISTTELAEKYKDILEE
ncbi:MAG: hypothetical protein KBS62_00240 [Oscillospiraceae bacterium]|nr:hypothetical protein [Candidatus Ruminococcus equi]